MKNIKLGLGILLIALLGISCKREAPVTVNTPAINITQKALVPNPDESGTVRAYPGDEVTAEGFNLDKVGAVRFDETEAEIVSKEIKKLVFKVPALDLPQQDEPQKTILQVFDADKSSVIFKYDFYVTVPVTDALVSGFSPKAGTVGTEVTITGRNLAQITKVTVGGVEATITDSKDAEVKLNVPPVPATQADSNLDIIATWSGGDIDVTADEPFVFSIPVFTSYTQTDPARLGDEISLSGENLDLVDGILWGETALLISEQSATAITIKVPTGIELMDPAVQARELAATYGTPAQKAVLAAAFSIDTTPVGPAAPVFSSAAPADDNYNALYLGKEVVVKGENFASIEKFKVDGIEATLSAEATDIEARFIMPKTITGTAAREVDLIAVWGGGNELDCGKITVLPFFYTKGLRLGKACGSALYTDFDASNAFLLLDEGVVVSTAEWKNRPVDPACTSDGNPLVVSGSTIATGKEAEYYACAPYIFMSITSNTQLQFNNPANSNSQLKNHRVDGTALPSQYGTPVIFMGTISDDTIKAACKDETLTDIASNTNLYGTSAPRWEQHWVKGDVIGLQYLNYDHVTSGGKASALTDIYKTGFMVVRDITMTRNSGNSNIESGGYVEVDLYWSNVLN